MPKDIIRQNLEELANQTPSQTGRYNRDTKVLAQCVLALMNLLDARGSLDNLPISDYTSDPIKRQS